MRSCGRTCDAGWLRRYGPEPEGFNDRTRAMTTFVGTSLLAQAYVQEMEYSDAQRSWQDRFDTRRIADRINQLLVHDEIDDGSRAFIESRGT